MAADSLRAADLQFGRYTTEWNGSARPASRYDPFRHFGDMAFFRQVKTVRSAGVYF